MSERDYRKLYRIQNKVLEALGPVLGNFYLTGGTALGRFYLNHRFSEDLDFFVNSDHDFRKKLITIGNKLENEFSILNEQTIVYDDYVKYYIELDNSFLKIEFVNDVQYRCGEPLQFKFGLVDNPFNILTNKLTAVVSRDEPKDIFDIYTIAGMYSFNWMKIFEETKKKVIINELDVEQRIKDFPAGLLQNVDWFLKPFNKDSFMQGLSEIANDFILGKDNSAGKNKPPIEDAVILAEYDTNI